MIAVAKSLFGIWLLGALLCGCASPAKAPVQFGDESIGFVMWLSETGDRAVVMSFDKDTNQDGKISARFGDHGELMDDSPTPYLIDTRTGKSEPFDAFVDSDGVRSTVLLRRGDQLVIVNGSSGKQTIVDRRIDLDLSSPCTRPVFASISEDGQSIGYISQRRAYVKNRADGKTKKLETDHDVWKIAQRNDGTLLEVAEDHDAKPPKIESSCGCWWCLRFARSYSRQTKGPSRSISLFFDKSGSKRPVPEKSNAHAPKEYTAVAGGLSTADRIPYLRITPGGDGPKKQMVSLNRPDFDKPIEGPFVSQWSKLSTDHGTWLGTTEDSIIVFHLNTGRVQKVAGLDPKDPKLRLKQTIIKNSVGNYLVNPVTGRTARVDSGMTMVGKNGCAVPRKSVEQFHRGPFTLICP